MPRRKVIFTPGQYYHLFNRSLGKYPIFAQKRQSKFFLEAIEYYLNTNVTMKFSTYRANQHDTPQKINYLLEVLAFSIMPNHFHFLVLENEKNGVKIFLQKLLNSYSHYFNTKFERRGPLFEGPFKAVRIESEEQLIHVSRYIHLNAVTAYLVENPADYTNSSYLDYTIQNRFLWLNTEIILNNFKSKEAYKTFILNQKDYQRKLKKIEHLLLD